MIGRFAQEAQLHVSSFFNHLCVLLYELCECSPINPAPTRTERTNEEQSPGPRGLKDKERATALGMKEGLPAAPATKVLHPVLSVPQDPFLQATSDAEHENKSLLNRDPSTLSRPHVSPNFGPWELPRPPETSRPTTPTPRVIMGELKDDPNHRYQNIQDVISCKDLTELGDEQKKICSSLQDSTPSESSRDTYEKTKKEKLSPEEKNGPARNLKEPHSQRTAKSKRKFKDTLSISLSEDAKKQLIIEEMQEGEAKAWLVGRDQHSRMAFSILVDTGNQAISCLPYHLFKRLCKGSDTELLDPYPVPVVGVGSKRIQVHGRLRSPIAIHLEGCEQELYVRPIIINSKRSNHLNLGMKDLSSLGVSLHLGPEHNWLQIYKQWIPLHSKADASRATSSQDPNFQMAYLNLQHLRAGEGHLEAEEIMQLHQLEQRVRNEARPGKSLVKGKLGFQWLSTSEALLNHLPLPVEDAALDQGSQWIADQLEKVQKQYISHHSLRPHLAKLSKRKIIPARTFMWVKCSTKFPFGTHFLCSPTTLSPQMPLLVPKIVMVRNCPTPHAFIPVYNCLDQEVSLDGGYPLAYLQAGEVSQCAEGEELKDDNDSRRKEAEDEEMVAHLQEEGEVVKGDEGEMHKCGAFEFPVELKSTQGHKILPPDEALPTPPSLSSTRPTFLPPFSENEVIQSEKEQRLQYAKHSRRENTSPEKEEGLSGKKATEMLQHLEAAPRLDGEWVHGDIRKIGSPIPSTTSFAPGKKLIKIEDASTSRVKELFENKLDLDNNEYIKDMPKEVAYEMKKELIEMLVKRKSAFSAGEEGNEFEEQIGECPWFQYQLVLQEKYRDTIFYEKPRVFSKQDTDAMRKLLEDWQGKGLIRKNDPTKGEGSPHSLPFFLVRKKTSSGSGIAHRGVWDGRKINSASIHRQVYMGSVAANLGSLEKCDLFCNLDIASFFNSLPLSNVPAPGHSYSSQDYCSFQTHSLGSFSFLRAPQGLHQSVSLASHIMDRVTRDLGLDVVKAFADDIMLCTKDDPEVREWRSLRHKQSGKKQAFWASKWRERTAGGKMISTLDHLLVRIIEAGLRLQLKKCDLMKRSIQWLGFEVSSEGVKIPQKIKQDLLDEPPPQSPSGLSNLLGRLSYFRQHIPGLSLFSARLHEAAVRSPINWKLSEKELNDYFMLRKAFLNSTAIGFVDYDNIDKNRLKVFIDFSHLGIAALVTQTQQFTSGDGTTQDKEVLVGAVAKKCPRSLRHASSCRGEAAALLLALHTFANILKHHHFILASDHLSLLYLRGLRSMKGQLWRLFEEVARHSFTVVHVRNQFNRLADGHSRRTNLPAFTEEEEEIFSSVLEEVLAEVDEQMGNSASTTTSTALPTVRQKGQPRIMDDLTPEEEQLVKMQQAKFLLYAQKLNEGLPLYENLAEVGQSSRGETFHLHPLLEASRAHHLQSNSSDLGHSFHLTLSCEEMCSHQKGWLPASGSGNEKVCISRAGQADCAVKSWSRDPKAVLHLEETGRIQGHLQDQISHDELMAMQKADEVLKDVYRFVQTSSWPNPQQVRRTFFHPEVLKYLNIKQLLCLDDHGVLCKKRMPFEEGRELKICLPRSLRDKVFKTCHFADKVHRGLPNTIQAISSRFHYFGMNGDLRARILDCGSCFTAKLPVPRGNIKVPELHSVILQGASDFNHTIAMDTSGRLPACSHDPPHLYFSLIVDLATGFTMCHPMANKRADTMKFVYSQTWVKTFTHPTYIRLDRGSENLNKTFLSFLAANGTKPIFTITGAARALYAERLNRDVKQALRAVLSTSEDQSEWCESLPSIVASINTTINRNTGFTPYRLVFAKDASTPLDNIICAPFKGETSTTTTATSTATTGTTAAATSTATTASAPSPATHTSAAADTTPTTATATTAITATATTATTGTTAAATSTDTTASADAQLDEPVDALQDYKEHRDKELDALAKKEFYHGLTETEKAKARYLRFAQLRENRIISMARTADMYSQASHPLFPLQDFKDTNKSVYIYTDRIPKGKSKSLTSKWIGPAKISSVISPILAVVTTQYRQRRFGKPEKTQACTIDRLYPFRSSHDDSIGSDAKEDTELVSIHSPSDLSFEAFVDGDMEKTESNTDVATGGDAHQDDDGDENEVERDNELLDVAHILPDDFAESPRPDPFQQLHITGQSGLNFEEVWTGVLSIEDPLLLNDNHPSRTIWRKMATKKLSSHS